MHRPCQSCSLGNQPSNLNKLPLIYVRKIEFKVNFLIVLRVWQDHKVALDKHLVDFEQRI